VSFYETGGKRPKARGAWESAMEKVGDRIVLRVEFRRRLIPCKTIWGNEIPFQGPRCFIIYSDEITDYTRLHADMTYNISL
jgi:hypothetical protein